MRKIIIIAIYLILFSSCKKVPSIDEVLTDLKISQSEVLADGQSTVSISVVLSDKSSTDRRSVIFTTSSGIFTSSGSNKYTSKAEFENGILLAKATLRSSTEPGTIKVSVKPEFDSPLNEYILTASIIAKPSVPVSIKLEPSSFGIASNFLNEVQITGILKNSDGKFVSKGNNVLFENLLLSGISANGHFRNLQPTTSDSSKVGGYYSANLYPIGTKIKIKCTVLDSNGQRTIISDSLLLTINQ